MTHRDDDAVVEFPEPSPEEEDWELWVETMKAMRLGECSLAECACDGWVPLGGFDPSDPFEPRVSQRSQIPMEATIQLTGRCWFHRDDGYVLMAVDGMDPYSFLVPEELVAVVEDPPDEEEV